MTGFWTGNTPSPPICWNFPFFQCVKNEHHSVVWQSAEFWKIRGKQISELGLFPFPLVNEGLLA